MTASQRLLVFELDGQRYGLPFERVERVLRVVEITPLPNAPGVVLGVINVHGRVIAVADPRRRFGLPPQVLDPGQQFVLVRLIRHTVALLVDAVLALAHYTEQDMNQVADIAPGTDAIAGVVRLEDGLVLIQDLDRFLSLDEESLLEEALAHA